MRTAVHCAVTVLVLAASLAAAPVKLARHPDYHAGKIAFSYLGDIWIAGEDGSSPHRLTDHKARDVYPRFSPDGHWVAFSSNRHGNYDVFVIAAAGGTPRRLTYHTGADTVVGWSRNSQSVIFQSVRGDRVFPSIAGLYQVSLEGGPEEPLPLDWGYYGAYSPDGKQFAFNRHPAVWSRKHYRGSYAADLWVADLAQKTYRKLLPDEQHNRFWPMWGANDNIYFVADRLPNEKGIVPGSMEVRKSVNNIWKIPARGGQPVQVTKHTDGNLFFPSISSDGKVIVYEENFGIWKLDTASGRTSEIKLDIASDEKENGIELVTINSEADSFDLSPSTRRAVISSRGQLFTIATDRGDITRVAPDTASRNTQPKWSPDGKLIAFISDRTGREEVWVSEPEGRAPKKITDSDTEKGLLLWAPDSKSLLYTASDKKLYRYSVADSKTIEVASSEVSRITSAAFSPDSKWVSFTRTDRTLRPHVYIAPAEGGPEHHITDDKIFSETGAVWTADGKYLVFTSSAGASGGIASTGRGGSMQLQVLALRDQERDPVSRDIDSEAAAAAAEAAERARQREAFGGGRAGAAEQKPPEVKIDLDGMSRRIRRLMVPGDFIGGLTPSPDGRSIAFVSMAAPGDGEGRPSMAIYTVALDGQRVNRVAQAAPSEDSGRRGFRGGFGGGLGNLAYSRDGRTLYYRDGRGIYAAAVGGAAGGSASGASSPEAPSPLASLFGRGGSSEGGRRRVSFTASIEVDQKAVRRQVFNEGWRVMKHRFYDDRMHGADWPQARNTYEALLDYVADGEELHTVMMQMIGELNASHTGVIGGSDSERPSAQTRYPGFELEADSSGYYRVGHIYDKGPADHDYLKIRKGDYVLEIDDHELKTAENYWKYFTAAAGRKFRFLLNSKPSKDGAWEVRVEPVSSTAHGTLQYQRWVDNRKAMVEKLTNGEIGYLHIRAMDTPSLRQFELDLVANRNKKALIIDQRFNGGGGIDQELLAILSQRKYQYTRSRDSIEVNRPLLAFYGPMVVMQNERSASDAEMFPQGFKDLKLGKTVGVTTYGAVIGTGAYTLMDGSTIRTPGSGVWTAKGDNMENFGVRPDVPVDNTPEDFLNGRDAQIEKAIEVLRAELTANKT